MSTLTEEEMELVVRDDELTTEMNALHQERVKVRARVDKIKEKRLGKGWGGRAVLPGVVGRRFR